MLVWVVEHLDAQHDEPAIMSPSKPDVVQIVESQAELGTDEGVGRGIQLASDAVRLETEDSCCNEIYIVPPSGNYWVPLD